MNEMRPQETNPGGDPDNDTHARASDVHLIRNFEPSAWLRHRYAELLHRSKITGHDVVRGPKVAVGNLNHGLPDENNPASWVCDRCETPCPRSINPFIVKIRPYLLVAGALCDSCYERETGRTEAHDE